MGDSLRVRPLNTGNQTRDVTHVFVHHSYHPDTLVNDVAVIRVRCIIAFRFQFSTILHSGESRIHIEQRI